MSVARDPDLPAQAEHIAVPSRDAVPKLVSDWLAALRLLKGVPFNYLVPDPSMLPPESIRFFHLDQNWVDCLFDGAYSLGRATTGDLAHDKAASAAVADAASESETRSDQTVSGLLLYSAVVQGWPGLEVAACDAQGKVLRMLRSERLAPQVLLCLFDGPIEGLAIHEPPETLHFGVDLGPDGATDPATFSKSLRPLNDKAVPVAIPYRDRERAVVDMAALARTIGARFPGENYTSADFSFQMVQGVGLINFIHRDNP